MFTRDWQEQNEHMGKWRTIYGRSRHLWSKELRLGGPVLETRLWAFSVKPPVTFLSLLPALPVPVCMPVLPIEKRHR